MAHFEQNSIFDLQLLGTSATAADSLSSPEDEIILLFGQLRDPLLRYTMSLGLGVSDGEDLVQDVFLSLFRHLCLQRPRSNLRGWVFRVAHNQALKRRGRALRFQPLAAEVVETHAAPDVNPEQQLALEQRQKTLLAVVDALPELDRNCLRLRAEGLRYREISRVLGISLGAVSNSIVRSLAKLNRADGRPT
jgi:RNA polymerase sigma-70 factor (ECF subfamily)